jgi:hypothetical protein
MSDQQTSPADTTSNNDTSDFFGGVNPSFSFEVEGDKARGIIVAKELRNATRILTDEYGNKKTIIDRWSDGRPKKVAILTLRTLDDQLVNLWVRGYMQDAFRDALQAIGLRDVQIGADVRSTWTSTDKPTQKGHNGARHYTVDYAQPGERLADMLDEKVKTTDEPPF